MSMTMRIIHCCLVYGASAEPALVTEGEASSTVTFVATISLKGTAVAVLCT